MDANTMLAAITAALQTGTHMPPFQVDDNQLWKGGDWYCECNSEADARLFAALLNAAGPMCEAAKTALESAAVMRTMGPVHTAGAVGTELAVTTMLHPFYAALVAAGAIAEVA